MMPGTDILVELTKEDIIELKETFRCVPKAFYVYTLLDVGERWFGDGDFTVTSPGGAWKQDGSIVVFINLGRIAIFPYSLDESYEKISEGLLKTSRIDPEKQIIFLNIMETYADKIVDSMKKMNRKVEAEYENFFYSMAIEKAKALTVECPDEAYIGRLTEEHAVQMNSVWPHRFEDSDKVVAGWLKRNVGFGLFLKADDRLVSWVMQGYLGHINLLQTEEEYMGRGYGKVMVRKMAKHLAENGHVPVATVLTNNTVSNNLFRKQGFQSDARSYFYIISKCNP